MSQRITIRIHDKIATCLTETPVVCGNSDYVIDFEFDEEWNAHNVKTAVFKVNGEIVRKVFEGTVCEMPVFQNTLVAWVGVFAGTIDDGTLSTSTPALVRCKPCVTDGDTLPAPPPDDVYNQIVELCNEALSTAASIEERANNGEFKGEKGDPTEVVQTTGQSESAVMSQKATTDELDKRVKKDDYATDKNAGVVKIGGGLLIKGEHIQIQAATETQIKEKKVYLTPITPVYLDTAVKAGLVGNKHTLTGEEKMSVLNWLGITELVGDIETALDSIIAMQNSLIGGESV